MSPKPPPRPPTKTTALAEVCAAFLKLGLTSFGGPVAHLGYVRKECVEARGWLADDEYADIVALCQFLPGPASSQVVFAVGLRRAGLLGGLAASVCFLLPSAAAMIGLAYGLSELGELRAAGWPHGLAVAAVAVVAQAVWSMGTRLCPDAPRVSLCLGAAALVVSMPGTLSQLGVLALGALAGSRLYREMPMAPRAEAASPASGGRAVAAVALLAFVSLLVVPRLLGAGSPHPTTLSVFDAFYRSGALVFGGGHVVLPLLRESVVGAGWTTDDAFLSGYGAVQAMPGPLFSFAAYLGAVIHGAPHAWTGGVWALFAIYVPGWLLITAALPFWHELRAKVWMQASLRGANASVVGVLLAAFYSPVLTEGVKNARDFAAALVAFALLQVWKAPPWLVVVLAAAAGQWLLR